MGTLPGDRPERAKNFHDKDGGHLFPHPETYARRSEWTSWDRRYAAHLDRHRELIKNPEPVEGDPKVVRDLFAHIAVLESIIEKEKKLIHLLRERAAAGGGPDDVDLPWLKEARSGS